MFRALVVTSLIAVLTADPASARSPVSRIPDRPCPDLSQILPYQRGGAVSDRRGGAFVAWVDDRTISVQHFGPTGAIVSGWPAPGLALGWISPGDEGVQAFVAADLAGGAFVAWIGHQGEVRLQRVTPACGVAPGWPAEGVVLCALAGTGRFPAVVACGRGSAMVVWREQETSGVQSIRLARVDRGGTLEVGWPANGRVLESGDMLPQVADLVPDDLGGAIAYWCRPAKTEGRTALVLERILANGDTAPGWPPGGLVVAERVELGLHIDEENGEPQLAADGRNGAWLVWSVTRPVRREEYETDVFILRVTGEGAVAPGWAPGGRMMTGSRDGRRAVIACDPGGLLVAWGDGVDGGRIGLAHVDASGSVRDWGRLAAMSLDRLAIGPDGRGGGYVACTGPGYAPRLLRWSTAGPGSPIGPPPTGNESDSSRLELVTEGGGALMFWADVEPGPPQYTRVRATSTRTATAR